MIKINKLIKKFLGETFLWHMGIYLRYITYRYIIERKFKNLYITAESFCEPVSKDISFFGYYNISPENKYGEVLYHKVKKEIRYKSYNDPADILLKDNNGNTIVLSQTKTWNWQQGSMLQWLPENNDLLIFNDFGDTGNISKIIDKNGKTLKKYNIAINNISKYNSYALCLNYDRLSKLRPDYGYFYKNENLLKPENKDGIWHLDLSNGQYKLIISLNQLMNISPSPTMINANHKVNHIDISPDGARFMFLHRWIGKKGKFTRLITANPDGSEIEVLNGDEMTSHSCWLDSQSILSYCKYEDKKAYFKFFDKSTKVQLFSTKMPNEDGHPSISPNKKYIITDTYPNKSRFSKLFLYCIDTDHIIELASFFQPLRYKKEMRIDLHPKWSPDSKFIYFESGHLGKRQLYKISLPKKLICL